MELCKNTSITYMELEELEPKLVFVCDCDLRQKQYCSHWDWTFFKGVFKVYPSKEECEDCGGRKKLSNFKK